MNELNTIEERMEVFCSCGKRIGKVDHVEGDQIKLAKNDSDDRHHFVPVVWVDSVDKAVVLNKNSQEAIRNWIEEPATV